MAHTPHLVPPPPRPPCLPAAGDPCSEAPDTASCGVPARGRRGGPDAPACASASAPPRAAFAALTEGGGRLAAACRKRPVLCCPGLPPCMSSPSRRRPNGPSAPHPWGGGAGAINPSHPRPPPLRSVDSLRSHLAAKSEFDWSNVMDPDGAEPTRRPHSLTGCRSCCVSVVVPSTNRGRVGSGAGFENRLRTCLLCL